MINPIGRHLEESRSLAAEAVRDKVVLDEQAGALRQRLRDGLSSPGALAWCFAIGTLSGSRGPVPDDQDDDEGVALGGILKKVGVTWLLGRIIGD